MQDFREHLYDAYTHNDNSQSEAGKVGTNHLIFETVWRHLSWLPGGKNLSTHDHLVRTLFLLRSTVIKLYVYTL